MKRHRVVVAAVAALLLQRPLQACGEKLLMIGRSIRFQSRHTPRAASVLLYLPQSAAAPLADPHLESALREAGHAVRAVTTTIELETALRSGSYDVVLSNVTDAAGLDQARMMADPNAVVLPAVYLLSSGQPPAKPQSRADRENASKAFGVVVEVPGRPGHYCAAVDKAMDLKLKRERTNARRP